MTTLFRGKKSIARCPLSAAKKLPLGSPYFTRKSFRSAPPIFTRKKFSLDCPTFHENAYMGLKKPSEGKSDGKTKFVTNFVF